MKKLINIFALLFFILTCSQQVMARDFELNSFRVRGVSKFSGPYISLYLVHGSKVFGQEITVNKVFKVLTSQKISGSDEMGFGPFSMKQNWSSFRGPNYVVAVIHPSAQHALNRHGVIDGTPTLFESPDFLNDSEKVEESAANKRLQIRAAISIKDLNAGKLLGL